MDQPSNSKHERLGRLEPVPVYQVPDSLAGSLNGACRCKFALPIHTEIYLNSGSPATSLSDALEAQQREIANLRLQLQTNERALNAEGKKVVALNLELLLTRVDIDRELKVQTQSSVRNLQNKLREMERERDYYKDGIDELQANLQKSKKMNAALLTFLSDILEKGIYPECRWEKLKEILTASTT